MALTLKDIRVGTIVDRVCEWKDGKEFPLSDRLRGIIVKVTGDVIGQQISDVWVAFGKGGEKIKVNGKDVMAVKTAPAELARYLPAEDKNAQIAWRRLFGEPVTVGALHENKQKAARRARVTDSLALTPKPKGAVVEDEFDGQVDGMDLPEAQA